jgi:conjugative relaxase-like TrwC/TraI family protein
MLTIAAISSSGNAGYYEKDDYYFGKDRAKGFGDDSAGGSGSVGRGSALTWGGAGAGRLGLAGQASLADFRLVMRGRNPDPDGPPLSWIEHQQRSGADGKSAGDRAEHKVGYDLTFSAPKSVSLAVLLGGDERLLAAHEAATAAAMAYAEKHFALTRQRDETGAVRQVATGNLLWAKTTHSTSRAGDPQIHSHVVVANATHLESKRGWRAIEGLALFQNRILLGLVYQGELARQAVALGYDIREHKGGTFELAAFTRQALEAFSKSTDRVMANIAREQPRTPAAKQAVKLIGRPKKLDVPEHELSGRWREEARAVGLDVGAIVDKALGSEPGLLVGDQRAGTALNGFGARLGELAERVASIFGRGDGDPYGYRAQDSRGGRDVEARQAVSYGLQVKEAETAVFTRGAVLRVAFEQAPKGMTVDRLDLELSRLSEDGRVVAADARVLGGITTDRSLRLEAEIVRHMRSGLGRSAPAYGLVAGLDRLKPGAITDGGAPEVALNAGQTAAAAMILTSEDRIIAIQGAAGVGKTTMFKVVGEALREKGAQVVGLAPTHTARQAMAEKAGFPAQTVQHVLTRYGALAEPRARARPDQLADWKGKVVVVDEASMLSNLDAARLIRVSQALGVEKLVLVGDQRQLGAVGAGAPFRHLLNAQIPHTLVEEIVRQRDEGLRASVEAFSKGRAKAGIDRLGLNVVEVGRGVGDDGLVAQAFGLWRAAKDEGVVRPVITVTQAQREAVNDLILADLGQRGEIRAVGEDQARLVQAHMAGPARWRAANYAEGQVLVFHSRHEASGMGRGEQVRIVGRAFSGKNNHLTVKRANGARARLDLNALKRAGPDKFLVYEEREGGQVHLGAAMVWERTDKERGLFAGQAFTPIGVKDGRFEIRLASGQITSIAPNDPQMRFVGPGYAMTTHRSQSLTLEANPIGLLHSRNASHALAYVQVSRAVDGMTLVTDDRQRLVQRLGVTDGMNLIAAEHVRVEPTESVKAAAKEAPIAELPAAKADAPLRDPEPWDPSQLKPEPEKSFDRDRPYIRELSK